MLCALSPWKGKSLSSPVITSLTKLANTSPQGTDYAPTVINPPSSHPFRTPLQPFLTVISLLPTIAMPLMVSKCSCNNPSPHLPSSHLRHEHISSIMTSSTNLYPQHPNKTTSTQCFAPRFPFINTGPSSIPATPSSPSLPFHLRNVLSLSSLITTSSDYLPPHHL
jgi:hypothetical protein